MLSITNTLSGKKEPFIPLTPGKVGMYVCGPTVYGLIHIGNARPNVFFDVVRRFFEHSGFAVTYVRNFTDVDDKIINRAREEKVSWKEIADKFIAEFEVDMNSLGVRTPSICPRVSEHIGPIIQMIEGLVSKGFAYVTADGEVLFSVRKFPSYGKLSGKNLDDLLAGARVDPGEKKRDPLDFSLWKPQKSSDEPAWKSPWGMGRPGWHIECSVMSMQYLGQCLDIHGGGMDLIHPHHENEIAQAEGFTGVPFVKTWMHNNLLNWDNAKMSKSLGNIILTRDFIKRYSGETLKFMLLAGHYRSAIDFSERQIKSSQAALHRYYNAVAKCEKIVGLPDAAGSGSCPEENALQLIDRSFLSDWQKAMEDDFNTAKVLGYVFDYVRAINAYVDRKTFKPTIKSKELLNNFIDNLSRLAGVLNIFGENSQVFLNNLRTAILEERGINRIEIEELIQRRAEARKRKDFSAADAIRNELLKKGIELQDRQ
ncbi:MAG: cysteine--tRNA ligase, partial [Deltaproteobacteria bacterium]|nr:cysteine--tRNA ligase [Deltaproteobacteria bacterium]